LITKGCVYWDDDLSPVVGYRVSVWDSDALSGDDFVGRTQTDNNGEYSIRHKKKQDPWWYGKKRRKGDFYIKVRKPTNGGFKTVYKSEVYPNYKPAVLEINAPLNRIIVEYGVNTVYGKIVARDPSWNSYLPTSGKVVAKDDDLLIDDVLGGPVNIKADGTYVIKFRKADYDKWFEVGENLPDIYVKIRPYFDKFKMGTTIETRTFSEASLPFCKDFEIPVAMLGGKVKFYKVCEGGSLVQKPVTDLVAKAWNLFEADHGDLWKKFYNPHPVISKGNQGIFTVPFVSFARHETLGISLFDKHSNKEVYTSDNYHWNGNFPNFINIDHGYPIEVIVECDN
jgi:hypothetical protein